MAKVKHNNLIDTLNTIAEDAKSKGVIQLDTEDEGFTGRVIRIKGKDLLHFGTTGYLGLELDQRLKDAAIDAINKFGTQFPLSRSYISHPLYHQLEEKLTLMFKLPVLVMKNSTLGHMGVIPSIVRDEDSVVLDHHVHWSVQNAALLLKNRGVRIDMIRHNNMDMLEDKIKELSAGGGKVWYFADGIYSMFGDVAPIEQLKALCARYPQLYLYFDDVHGMSWIGRNGTGFVLDQFADLPENVFIFSTLSKSFGASGGMLITSNRPYFNKIKNFGGPLTFSAQLEPASVGAAIASADIHLSKEIYELQADLHERIKYCNDLLAKTSLPLVERNDCPVFYIGTGAPAVGYNYINKLYNAGFYANMGIFPAVPVKKTGVRFTISRHNRLEDIRNLVDTLSEAFPKALQEESYSANHVRRIFNLPLIEEAKEKGVVSAPDLKLLNFGSISEIDRGFWDGMFAGEGVFDHAGLTFLEKAFKQNQEEEHNWQFFYVLVQNAEGNVVAATFLTYALWKEDMLAPASVSREFEEKRLSDPSYMTSRVLILGSLFTEGNHLYLDRQNERWKDALDLLIGRIEELDEQLNPSTIVLRDFDPAETELKEYILKKGYFQISLPEACIMDDLSWNTQEEYFSRLSAKSRKHFRKDIEPYIPYYNIEVKQQIDSDDLCHFTNLYKNVWRNNFDMNTFSFSRGLFEKMSEDENWEFLVLRLKEQYDDREEKGIPVGVMFCYKGKESYVPAFIGMDYEYVTKYQLYRQMLYQTILRAKSLKVSRINFGFSSSFEKRKVGARIIPKVAYMQAKDNYSMEMIGVIQKQ